MSWIKTEEQMPPSNKTVLLLQKTGLKDHTVIIVGHWVDKFTVEGDSDYSEYCEEKDEYFLPEGFYEHQFNWDEYASIGVGDSSQITHWMPLPKKPVDDEPTIHERYPSHGDEQDERPVSIYKDHDDSGHGRRDFE